jgi:precorrin-2 dehydrogenase/sirohydrochlorin ferrochelatase
MSTAAPQYPVNLRLEGRPCLVVGGGRVAARKVEGLAVCGARVHVVAPEVGAEIKAMAGVTWEERGYEPREAARYRLVIAATDRDDVNRMVCADGDAAGTWASRADDAGSGSFTLPSVVRRGALMVTVSTGGRSPALSAWIGRHVAREMGPEYETLLEVLAAERAAQRAAGRPTADLDWQKALDSDMLDLIRAGEVTKARERLRTCLSSS